MSIVSQIAALLDEAERQVPETPLDDQFTYACRKRDLFRRLAEEVVSDDVSAIREATEAYSAEDQRAGTINRLRQIAES